MTYPISASCQIKRLNDIYGQYFHGKTDGVFVEVGGHDGYSWSNTWGLAEVGWRGLYYEPIPDLAERCKVTHANNNVKVLNVCVGDQFDEANGKVKLWIGSNPTIDEETMKLSPWDGDKYDPNKFIMSPCVTLNTSLVDEDIPHEFDLLSIDVEGAELHVLNGLDLHRWHPKMIIIETHNKHSIVTKSYNAHKIIEHVLLWPYEIIYDDTLNTIFYLNESI